MKLIVVLGDQLSHTLSSLKDCDKKKDVVVMMEVWDETQYVKHHPKKIAFLFSAMRHFALELEDKGYQVHYIQLEEKMKSFSSALKPLIKEYKPDEVVLTEPGEYRVLEEFEALGATLLEDDRFFCSIEAFKKWSKGKKSFRQENFYEWMRKETGILMKGGKPLGGKWNFDEENREPLNTKLKPKGPKTFTPDAITKEVLKLVKEKFSSHFGDLEPFWYGVTRKQALEALDHFIKYSLPHFGTYQDAMQEGEYYLFHSLLSQYLNCGLLLPSEVCEKAEKAKAPLNCIEGFIRQILGWREFIRGIYWTHMPKYKQLNTLKAKRALPEFYWTAKTDMNCMKQVIEQTKATSQSHHIQRLMVTGNFALLAGLDPEQVCEWYLAVYLDAYEWVELPNTLGMALHGDGGIVGSKPYAASGNYIDKMSNFCKNCRYNVKEKTGDNACPFNYLYWNFFLTHEDTFKKNPRLKFVYNTLSKKSSEEKNEIKNSAKRFLSSL